MSSVQEYSTNTKRIFLYLFLLINVTMQQFADDVRYLSRPSGEFTSPGYPDTISQFVGWNITVDQDHQILLQFLDFELVERERCKLDVFEVFQPAPAPAPFFRLRYCPVSTTSPSPAPLPTGPPKLKEVDMNYFLSSRNHRTDVLFYCSKKVTSEQLSRLLYERVFAMSMQIERMCWDSFDKLNNTKFISRGNIFLLRLRTIYGEVYSRKGFKANYSSIPKKATTTATVDVTQKNTPDKLTNAPTISTQNVNPSTAFTDSTSDISTVETNVTESSNVLKFEKYYVIAAAGGFLIICIFCLPVCCCLCYRKNFDRNKTQDSSKSNDSEFQVLAPAGPVQSSQTSHEGTNFSVKTSNSSKNEFTVKDNKKSSRPPSAFSSPTYAIPDKEKHEVFENDEYISRQSKVKENKGKLRVPLNPTYATPHAVRPDSTEFEVNVAYQSCDSEKEDGSNMTVPVNDEYTYVENTNVITDRPTAAPMVRAGEFKHSSLEKEEDELEGSVPNIAYQSFDLEEELVKEQDEEMTTNVAYQSCDSEEENVDKSDATYYYVDEEGSNKREEQKDIVYESV